ncbi:MAG: nucleoside-diphosphate kinase [Microcystis sp.]
MQQQFSFILFSPDCTVTRLYLDAIDWLRSRKIIFLAFSWKRLSIVDTQNLYRKNRSSRSHTYLDDLVDELFSLDYSLASLVSLENSFSDDTIYSELIELKGPSNPQQAKSIHLRRWLGATNKILNFIHTSDDSQATINEASLFFDLNNIKYFPKDNHNILPAPPSDLRKLRSVSGFAIRLALKERLINSSKVPIYSSFKLLLEQEKYFLNSCRDHLSLSQELSLLLQRQKEIVETTTNHELLRTPLLSLIQASLDKIQGMPLISGLIKILEVAECQLSPWEYLVIRCEESTL